MNSGDRERASLDLPSVREFLFFSFPSIQCWGTRQAVSLLNLWVQGSEKWKTRKVGFYFLLSLRLCSAGLPCTSVGSINRLPAFRGPRDLLWSHDPILQKKKKKKNGSQISSSLAKIYKLTAGQNTHITSLGFYAILLFRLCWTGNEL